MPAQLVRWGQERREVLRDYMRYDLQRAIDERQPLEKLWRRYLEVYRAPTPVALRKFPFEGASNYTFPLMAATVDPILARLIRTIHAPTNLWTVVALNEAWVPVAKPVQDFLEYIDFSMLHMMDVNYRTLLEMLKLGTAVYKVGWKFQKNRVMGYDQQLRATRVIRNINQPLVDQVHMANFFLPPEAYAIDPDEQDGASWVAERFRIQPEELEAFGQAQEPYLPNFDKDALAIVLKFEETAPTLYQQQV